MRSLPGEAQVVWVRGKPRVETPGAGTVLALLGATVAPGRHRRHRRRRERAIAVVDGQPRHRRRAGADHARRAADAGRTAGEANADRRRARPRRNHRRPATHPAQRHEIRTPVVTTAVRGTEFRVSVDPDATSVATEVTDGAVGVGRGTESVAVAGGLRHACASGGAAARRLARCCRVPTSRRSRRPRRRLPVRVRWPALAGATGLSRQCRAGAATGRRWRISRSRPQRSRGRILPTAPTG